MFDDIIEQFIGAIQPAITKAARSRNKSIDSFCCVIGPSGVDTEDGQKFTMNTYERQVFIEKMETVDPYVVAQLEAPTLKNTARTVVFFKGVIFVKDIPLIPAQNSRGGSA